MGLARGARDSRLASGRYFVAHRGVYAVGHQAVSFRGRAIAALRATGPHAALSHGTAAAVWGFAPEDPDLLHVTVPGGGRRSRAGLAVHVGGLDRRRELREHEGLRLTAPVRTVLDLAAVWPAGEVERACTEAVVLKRFREAELRAAVEAASGRRGVRALRRMLDGGSVPTRSELERAMLRIVGAAGLQRPRVNQRIGLLRVDFLWASQRVVVETDGWARHRTRTAFESDRARDASLQARGWVVLRFTWRQVMREPAVVTARLAATLALRQDRRDRR